MRNQVLLFLRKILDRVIVTIWILLYLNTFHKKFTHSVLNYFPSLFYILYFIQNNSIKQFNISRLRCFFNFENFVISHIKRSELSSEFLCSSLHLLIQLLQFLFILNIWLLVHLLDLKYYKYYLIFNFKRIYTYILLIY